jgi:hypothetical protein
MDNKLDNNGRLRNIKTLAKPLTLKNIEFAIVEFDLLNRFVHSYEESTRYDLVFNLKHYPPKAIFGLALSKLLGYEVKSSHFTGGINSPCFQTLESLGLQIAPKQIVRATEVFEFENLVVGSSYSRMKALEAANATEPHQARDISGKTRFQNCVVLFVTLDKQGRVEAYKYNDLFLLDGKQFHWESQSKNTVSTPSIRQIIDGFPAVLFVRLCEKVKGRTQPFIYAGQLEYIEHCSEKPVQILYNVIEFETNPSEELRAIYSWNSDQGVDVDVPSTAPEIVKRVKLSGQGFMLDSKKKKAIELYAMGIARMHYLAEGYDVVDTSHNCPYDLECYKNGGFRRVEVKGTISKGDSVFVTSGEVIDANSDTCETDLFIVSNIVVKAKDKEGNYATSEGSTALTVNWKPGPENLEPKAYKYHVNGRS